MSRMILTRTIDAPVDLVFQAVADIRQFSQALPHIVDHLAFHQRIGTGKVNVLKRAEGTTG